MSISNIKVNNSKILQVDERIMDSENLVKNKAVYKELVSSTDELIVHNRNTASCTGIFSKGYCYVLGDPIPAGYSITALEVQKVSSGQNTSISDFVLVDTETDVIMQTFPCTFDSLNERSLYSQTIPETYNETNCYFGILVKSTDTAYVGSSYPDTYTGHNITYTYDAANHLLTNKKALDYDIGIYLKIGKPTSRFDKIESDISNINKELYIRYEGSTIGSIN